MTIWTQHDETKLQHEIEMRAVWQRVLEKSAPAASVPGFRSSASTECRQLIARADQTIARLLARKSAAQVAA